MTIALTIELKEDWGRNMPEVIIKAKTFRGEPQIIARITPQNRIAHVTLTRANDLIVEPSGGSATIMEDRK